MNIETMVNVQYLASQYLTELDEDLWPRGDELNRFLLLSKGLRDDGFRSCSAFL